MQNEVFCTSSELGAALIAVAISLIGTFFRLLAIKKSSHQHTYKTGKD